jgi:arylsulfatase A-like enzyme
MMKRREFLRAAACAPALLSAQTKARPNIVVIYADDLGYGDVGCYGAKKVATPNIDKVAARGIRFTDAHSTSATCTPSRYSMLTGEYAWRKKGTGVLPGSASLIIEPGRTTLASMLKQAGYTTGVVGKWHLGLGSGNVDWNGEIKPGPLEIGFDYSFLIPATGDRVPCVYVENRRVVGLDPKDPIQVSYGKPIGNEPTGKDNPELLKVKPSHGHDQTIVNGVSRIGYMSGGKSARWVDEDMADTITRKAVSFIDKNKDKPFFLYFATHDIHVPRVPHPRFVGKSQCGVRCDAAVEFDWSVGEVVKALERNGLTKNTLVIVSSDNGPVVDDGYQDGAVEKLNGHTPAGPLRGGKYSAYEAGTRVPFIVSWPGRIKPGISDALVSQIDFLRSFAALTGAEMPKDAAPDSVDSSAALTGEAKDGRDHLVEQARGLALRTREWKLVPPGAEPLKAAGLQVRSEITEPELYNVKTDIGEKNNVAAAHPDVVKKMMAQLEAIRSARQ